MILRELAPQDLKIELARTTSVGAVALGRYLGRGVGKAHARQTTDADRKVWNTALKGH